MYRAGRTNVGNNDKFGVAARDPNLTNLIGGNFVIAGANKSDTGNNIATETGWT
jgi:hypothetical protein